MTRTLLLGKEDYSSVIDYGTNHSMPTLRDYDFVEMVYSTRADIATPAVWNFKFDVKSMLEGKHMTAWLWHHRWHRTRIRIFDNIPHLEVTGYGCQPENSYNYTPLLFKVYGVKI